MFPIRSLRHFPFLIVAAILLLSQGCTHKPPVANQDSGAKTGVDFVTEVKPILLGKCVMCHNRKTLSKEKPSFESKDLAFRPGPKGAVIVPGNPDASRLIQVISVEDFSDDAMPPVGHRVDPAQLVTLRQWIAQGAPWPDGSDGKIVPGFIPAE